MTHDMKPPLQALILLVLLTILGLILLDPAPHAVSRNDTTEIETIEGDGIGAAEISPRAFSQNRVDEHGRPIPRAQQILIEIQRGGVK